MPPKRKASAVDEPPARRVLRSGTFITDEVPIVKARPESSRGKNDIESIRPIRTGSRATTTPRGDVAIASQSPGAKRRGRPRTAKTVTVADQSSKAKTSSSINPVVPTDPVKRRSRLPLVKHASTVPVYNAQASASSITSQEACTSAMIKNATSPEADELLLTAVKRRATRPVTPTRNHTPQFNDTPRLFMHSVEIRSPAKNIPQPYSWRDVSPLPVQRVNRRAIISTPIPSVTPSTPKKPSSIKKTPPSKSRSVETTVSPRTPRRTIPPLASLDLESNEDRPTIPFARISTVTPSASPLKGKVAATPHASPSRLPHVIPTHLHSCLNAQKRATLRALQKMPEVSDEDGILDQNVGSSTNAIAYQQLHDLLTGTVVRGEGNSCLIIGPRGSGKTHLVDRAIAELPEKPIIIRLSGHVQYNDRLAIREIAWQLTQQTGNSFLPADSDEDMDAVDRENPFLDTTTTETTITLPPPSHLLALISMIPTLPRPTIIVLDAFDLFATHARQSLLYCLLDTAQSCRVGRANKGLALLGVTTRIDTINMLEKRVKSRFSGRILRTACPTQFRDWIMLARTTLNTPFESDDYDEWSSLWALSIEQFLSDHNVITAFGETFALTADVRILSRILTTPLLGLTPSSPFLSPSQFIASVEQQRCPPRFSFLSILPYPAICLLIAAVHTQTSGHDIFTFEMLHETFRDQVRASLSAPVQIEGGGIGMVRCSREVFAGAFERLTTLHVFVSVSPPSATTPKAFVRYRCAVDRSEIKKAVEKMGQTNLKKWFMKAQ